MNSSDRIEARRAIEALRAGVPNRDAVRVLGCDQSEIEHRFQNNLAKAASEKEGSAGPFSLLVRGDFGSGKSHLLEYLMHLALEQNFVCSRIVISKETPLFDPVKIYRTAVKTAIVPDKRGDALTEIATRLDTRGTPYQDFYVRLNQQEKDLDQRFAATVFLYDRTSSDPELSNRIIRFWSGEKIGKAEIKRYLKACRASSTFQIGSITMRDLALQRFKFASLLIRAAGYAGWVLLIDEVELIGRYSMMQRAKSYAELARWMGRLEDYNLPNITAVLAITADFESAVLQEKDDLQKIPQKLRMRAYDTDILLAAQADRGMRVIQQDSIPLRKPSPESINALYEKARSIHGVAYGWAPPLTVDAEWLTTTRLREYIRKWITEWDLTYLDNEYRPDIEVREIKPEYTENGDLETAPEESSEQEEEIDE